MKKFTVKAFSAAAAAVMAMTMLTSCGSSDYSSYASAYKKVTANGGMNADFALTLKMDGVTTESDGNFKLDTSDGNNILYYTMKVDGEDIIQFSDGSYIYTESEGHKTKYALNSKPSASAEKDNVQQKDAQASGDGTFNSTEFLKEFSSFLEAGKIKELGLLSPIEQGAIKSIKAEGSSDSQTFTLEFSENLVKKYLNIMIENETGKSNGETLSIDEMTDFSYVAQTQNGVVTGTVYSGVIKVTVPASLMSTGEQTTYDMDFCIDIDFVDPGSKVSVSLPSTDGFELIS
ncbi:MAG: hypothetical protein ACI4SF_10060 [Oscillospiraceae bacterium]